MCIMQVIGRVINSLVSISPLIQAIFAVLVWFYIKKQTKIFRQQADISDGQTEIMNKQAEIAADQNKVTQEIDESNKAMTMLTRYTELSRVREKFWICVRTLYSGFKGKIDQRELGIAPENVYSLIKNGGFPPDFCPDSVTNLLQFIKDNEGKWTERGILIWEFAKSIDIADPGNTTHEKALKENRHDLAYFWDLWSQILEVRILRKYLQPDSKELLMLTWLEFALVKQTQDDGRPGKKWLFKLAKAEWESQPCS